jgi:hypothetical protein
VILERGQLRRRLRRVADDVTVFGDQGDTAGAVLPEPVGFAIERVAFKRRCGGDQVCDEARFVRQTLRNRVTLTLADLPGEQEGNDRQRHSGGGNRGHEELRAKADVHGRGCCQDSDSAGSPTSL